MVTKSSQDWARALSEMGGAAWLAGAIVGALLLYAVPGALAQMLSLRKPFRADTATLEELREHIRAGRKE